MKTELKFDDQFRRIFIIVKQPSQHLKSAMEKTSGSSTGTTLLECCMQGNKTQWPHPLESMANTYLGHNVWTVYPIFMPMMMTADQGD